VTEADLKDPMSGCPNGLKWLIKIGWAMAHAGGLSDSTKIVSGVSGNRIGVNYTLGVVRLNARGLKKVEKGNRAGDS
jgi:hypothetical protein